MKANRTIEDVLDTFPAEVMRAAQALSFGEEVEDPLMLAAARVYLGDVVSEESETASNGRLRFACYVSAR